MQPFTTHTHTHAVEKINKRGETHTKNEKQVGSAGSLFRIHHKDGAVWTGKGLEEKGVAYFTSNTSIVCVGQELKYMLGYGQLKSQNQNFPR